MIIVISGKQGAGKSTFARALAASIFPQYPYVIDPLPTKKPAFLGQMTIFTWPSDSEFPNWLLKRKDFTVINISILKYKLPNPKEVIGLKVEKTQRGFSLIEFEDRYKQKCSLQKSSLATEDAIWLGVDVGIPVELGGKGEPVDGRMHLTRKQVRALLPHLQAFVETGSIVLT